MACRLSAVLACVIGSWNACFLTAEAEAICSGPPPLAERVAKYQHLVLVKHAGDQPATEGATTYRVVDVAKSKGSTIKTGDFIVLKGSTINTAGTLYSLSAGDLSKGWHRPGEVNAAVWQYVKALPPPPTEESETAERAMWFVPYLEHEEPGIAQDAYQEVSRLSYPDLKLVAAKISREQLRQWITARRAQESDIGTYSLCLASYRNKEDTKFFREIIVDLKGDGSDTYRMGINGVMCGYVICGGETALGEIDELRLRATSFTNANGESNELPFSETYAGIEMLRLLWNEEQEVVSKDRLKQSMRILLDRPTLADLAVGYLSRWEDWASSPRVMRLFDESNDINGTKRAVVRYFMTCVKVTDAESREHVAAKQHLETLKEKDLKIYKQVERFFNL